MFEICEGDAAVLRIQLDGSPAHAVDAHGERGLPVEIEEAHGALLYIGEGVGRSRFERDGHRGDGRRAEVEGERHRLLLGREGDELVAVLPAVVVEGEAEVARALEGEAARHDVALLAGEAVHILARIGGNFALGEQCALNVRRKVDVEGRENDAVLRLDHLLRDEVARPCLDVLRRGGRLRAARPAHHVGVLAVRHRLGGVEEVPVEGLGLGLIHAVARIRRGVPQNAVLRGEGEVPLVADLEGVRALEVPHVAHDLLGVGEDDAAVLRVAQIAFQGVFYHPADVVLRRRDGERDGVRRLVVVGLRVAEVVLLPEFRGRLDLPARLLLKGRGARALGDHDGLVDVAAVVVAGVEEVVLLPHLDDGTRAHPRVLFGAARGLENGLLHLFKGDEVLGRREVQRVVVGIAALLQIVDVVDAVLVVGHGVAHIGLVAVVLLGEEEVAVIVSLLHRPRRAVGREVLVVLVVVNGRLPSPAAARG